MARSFLLYQFSYAAAAASLDDRSRFPNFWRTYPSEDNLADALVAIVREYGWRQLRIITQQESLFTAVREGMEGKGREGKGSWEMEEKKSATHNNCYSEGGAYLPTLYILTHSIPYPSPHPSHLTPHPSLPIFRRWPLCRQF